MVNLDKINELVGGYCKRENVSEKQLAEAIGLNHRNFYNRLKGYTRFTLDEASALADEIGCSINEFVNQAAKS